MVATGSLRRELAGRGFRNVRAWTRGVDLERFKPVPVAMPYPRPVFLYVGRVAVEKNLGAFLLLDLPGTTLVVGDGPQRHALARGHPAAQFLGERHGAALAEAYAGADAFVFPSLTDTFGLVLLESLACGTPIAAHPVTGPADILEGAPPGVGALDHDLRAAAMRALAGTGWPAAPIPNGSPGEPAPTRSWRIWSWLAPAPNVGVARFARLRTACYRRAMLAGRSH